MLQLLLRLLPVVLLTTAAAVWFNAVQESGPYVLRNLLPLAVLVLLSALALWRGKGSWTARNWQLALGTLGFAIPALGLSAYLHYAYDVNLDGMFSGAQNPGQLFRFLPYYTMLAGAIGFAIGWIVGRKL
ncbi:MAG: hypothetical protein OEW64_14735 [Gammaproteobacteria bacterium]|nr:hypothetical protein [Gammaproteobacteria bacterium]MDH5305341.1 hypothetical protein [Gammaproteobacteria bacterium]MDH5323486.1 hypothetical protein [Gammaproteobacteria bacterium]